MDYCGPRGIRHSKFLKWSQLDQEKALAWLTLDRSRCPGCGTTPLDWDETAGGDRDAYLPNVHYCRGDELLERIAISDSDKGMGARKQLIPNRALRMWGGQCATSADVHAEG